MGERWNALVVVADPMGAPWAEALRAAGADVQCAATTTQALAVLMETKCEVTVLDLDLAGEHPWPVVETLREDQGQAPILALTRRLDTAHQAIAFAKGVDDVLSPSIEPAELLARVNRRRQAYAAYLALRAEAAALHALATTDGLTDVANHRAFQHRLLDEFRRAQRYDDALALMLVDLDHFKTVNDTFGHQVGDQALVAVAAAIKESVRETDYVARYGGEEFAILLPKTHLAGALTVAERIAHELKSVRVGPTGLPITASVGVSSFPGRAVSTAEQLVKTADEALYRSKREGRNKISLFQASLLASAS